MKIEDIHRSFSARVRSRRPEIEQVALTRIQAVSDPREGSDPEYRDGLRAAVSAALEYGIEALERSEDRPAPIPDALLSQARLAARYGVGLETVVRRYIAGYNILGDFLIQESTVDQRLNNARLKRTLRVQAAVLDRLIAAVSAEYGREASARPGSTVQRRLRRVEQLLAGEQVDAEALAYDLDTNHLGLIAFGADAMKAVGEVANSLDCRHLLLPRDENTVWAWFGSRRRIHAGDLEHHLPDHWPAHISLALGEPAKGIAGWRLTHRQAKAAASIARDADARVTRYANVAVLASIRQDEVLVASLRLLYLAPLARAPGGGAVLRETLRAYLAAGRNVSSAAASLRVHRRTVTNRLHTIERYVGRRLEDCAMDLEIALQLDNFDCKR